MSTENPWKTLNSIPMYENPWIKVTEHQVLNPKGGEGIYGEIHFKNIAVGVLPLDEELYTWLVGQYRYPLKAYSWEIPEGGSPEGEVPLHSAQRELLEETGFTAGQYTELLRMHLSNSVSDELAIIYLARTLTPGPSAPEETEELSLKRVPFEEAYQMVMDGLITDSMSVAAILKVRLLLAEGKLS